MDLMKTLKDKSQHLIIVDPPYFQVKGKFDFVWYSFESYLKDFSFTVHLLVHAVTQWQCCMCGILDWKICGWNPVRNINALHYQK